MGKIYQNITSLVGNTPLLELSTIEREENLEARVIVKLEYFNPGGSVKDRIALAMVEDAERRGALKPGGTIIEPTSGNTGVGLAMVAAAKGYKAIIVMPDTMSQERRKLIKAYGATLVLTPGAEGMKGSIAKAQEILASTDNAIIPQQFENPANAAVHYLTTGQEIWKDTEGQVDIFVAGVGTGGTLSGVARALKEHKASVKAYAVEPAASPVLAGGKPAPHKMRTTRPWRAHAALHARRACWWASRRGPQYTPPSSWPRRKRTWARPSWPCCPTRASATCRRRSSTSNAHTRHGQAGRPQPCPAGTIEPHRVPWPQPGRRCGSVAC